MDEADEQNVELLVSGEDSAESFEAAEQPLDLVSPLVDFGVVFPRLNPVPLRRNDGIEAEVEGELAGLGSFAGSIHHEMERGLGLAQLAQQSSAFRRVVALPGESEKVMAVRASADTI